MDQRRANAGRDNIGRDKNNIGRDQNNISGDQNNFVLERKLSQLELWLDKFCDEKRNDAQTRELVDSLQHFLRRVSHDGIVGLENKLDRAGHAAEIDHATRQKEEFGKLLARFGHYASAQEVFAFLLSKVEKAFTDHVKQNLGSMSFGDINLIITDKAIDPIMDEMANEVFVFNYNHAEGMIYWLAEQCFIRWHK